MLGMDAHAAVGLSEAGEGYWDMRPGGHRPPLQDDAENDTRTSTGAATRRGHAEARPSDFR